jgi:hypothetical protein
LVRSVISTNINVKLSNWFGSFIVILGNMYGQISFSIACIRTIDTRKWFFACMCSDMISHVLLCFGFFWTKWALEISGAHINWFVLSIKKKKTNINQAFSKGSNIYSSLIVTFSNMLVQISFITWCISTIVTTKGFFACMYSDMILHVLLCSSFFWTKWASVISLAHKNWFVL